MSVSLSHRVCFGAAQSDVRVVSESLLFFYDFKSLRDKLYSHSSTVTQKIVSMFGYFDL